MSLIRKLRKMSVPEITFRCWGLLYEWGEKAAQHAEAGKLCSDAAFFQKISVKEKSADGLLKHMRNRQDVAFFISGQNKQAVIEAINVNYPGLVQKAIEQADKICRHEFSFLGIEAKYENDILWTIDPVSLKEWPMKFYADVNISGRDIGDVKHVWELNRHQFFVDLGKAYWLTGNEKYAREL